MPLLAALIAAGAILIAVYPGFMSYDSLRAYREARGQVGGGTYPPFVSYVWRVVDAVWPGPALMLLVQNFLLVLSFATILRTLGYRNTFIAIGVLIFCLAPPILGPMLVVWKDVGVSACLCAAVSCFLAAERGSNPRLATGVGILLLFCGAAYRLNAISGVVPLVIWLSWERGFLGASRRRSLAAGMAILVCIALGVTIVNRVRFPDFELLPPNNGFESMMIFDLAAMSALTGRDLMPELVRTPAPKDTSEYFRKIYDPRHNEIVTANDTEGRLKLYFGVPWPRVHAAFFAALGSEPGAYVEHRTAVFLALVGLTPGPTFMPTQSGIDENEFGLTHHPTRLTVLALHYIMTTSGTLLGKPWFYYLLGMVAVAKLIARGSGRLVAALAVLASAALYLLSFYFITPAADVRYNHWSIVCMFIVMALAAAPAPDGTKHIARA